MFVTPSSVQVALALDSIFKHSSTIPSSLACSSEPSSFHFFFTIQLPLLVDGKWLFQASRLSAPGGIGVMGLMRGCPVTKTTNWLAFCSAHATRHSLFFQSRSVYSLWSLSKRRIIRIFLVNHKRTCQLAHNTRTPSFLRAGDVQRQPSFQQESSKQRHCLGWNGGPKNFDPASEPMLHISVVPGSGGMEAESDPKGTCKN